MAIVVTAHKMKVIWTRIGTARRVAIIIEPGKSKWINNSRYSLFSLKILSRKWNLYCRLIQIECNAGCTMIEYEGGAREDWTRAVDLIHFSKSYTYIPYKL